MAKKKKTECASGCGCSENPFEGDGLTKLFLNRVANGWTLEFEMNGELVASVYRFEDREELVGHVVSMLEA